MNEITEMNSEYVQSLDGSTLRPIVRAALRSNTIEVGDWNVRTLAGGSTEAGVYLVSGTAQDQGKTQHWSLILKEVSAPESSTSEVPLLRASDDPPHIGYWRRELLLYRSGIYDDLPVGMAAPRCYHIDEQPGVYRLWLEDVSEGPDTIWPLERYGVAARHLGRFNGQYLCGEALPQWPWLLTDLMRQRAVNTEWQTIWDQFDRFWDEHATVRCGWPDGLAQDMRAIWRQRERFLSALARLPRVLEHGDAGRKNLFDRQRDDGEVETVAIDWAWAGIGAVGEELAPVVCSPVQFFNNVQPAQLPTLEQIAFDGYLQGLRDAGWRGNPAQVRLGYTATVALRYGPSSVRFEPMAITESGQRRLEAVFGHSINAIIDNVVEIRRFAVKCAHEAQQLMAV
jgi:hypothetical protein